MFKHRSIGIILLAIACQTPFALGDPKITEEDAAPIPQQMGDARYAVSPHGVHVAAASHKGSRWIVTVDGTAGPRFDEIMTPSTSYIDSHPITALQKAGTLKGITYSVPSATSITFSGDGKRYAYLARDGGEFVLMIDNKESFRFPKDPSGALLDYKLEFTGEEGKHLMFAKMGLYGYDVWVDGQKIPGAYQSAVGAYGATDPSFSADGEHYAYPAQIDKSTHATIVDGKDAGYNAEYTQYTADGKHLFAIVPQGQVKEIWVDGKSRMKADGVAQLFLSPAGEAFGAVLIKNQPRGVFLVANGKKVDGTDCTSIPAVAFSADMKHVAAVCVASPRQTYVVVDGKKGGNYDFITHPDALAFTADNKAVYVGQNGQKSYVVVGDDESDGFNNLASFLISPSGKHVVMNGSQSVRSPQSPGGVTNGMPMIIDDKVEHVLNASSLDSFTFSADETRHAYFAGSVGQGAGTGAIVADGKDTGLVGNFTFDPTGKHLAVVGYRAADTKHGIFLDGRLLYEGTNIRYRAFSPDGNHLYWFAMQPLASTPGLNEYVLYLDGKAVYHMDQIENNPAHLVYGMISGNFIDPPPAWSMGADGSLTFLALAGDNVKRVTVTP